MWAKTRWIVGIGLISLASTAQAAVPWALTLEEAKRTAAQTNRLVLVHFWAPWCTACIRMEREVFDRPGVARAMQAGYVPVKVNTEQFPEIAQQYGIRSLPTDAILTPEGHLVHRTEGALAADQYAAKLHQVVATAQARRHGPYASIAGQRSVGSPPATYPPSRQPAEPADRSMFGRYGVPRAPHGDPGEAAASPMPGYAARTTMPAYPAHASVAPQYPPMRPSGMPETPRQPPSATPDQPDHAAAPDSVPEQPAGEPDGNPPLALDGYCCVQLWDDMTANIPKWTLGDRRWGAIHRGRTYLFSGLEQQQRFLAAPDRFAPVLSGNDPVLMVEQHREVPGRREHGVFHADRVWLFSGEESLERFRANPEYYAEQALHAMGL